MSTSDLQVQDIDTELGLSAYIVLAIILGLVVVLYRAWLRPTVAFIIAIVFLMIVGVLSPNEALAGLANEQLAIIIMLLIISNTLSKTGLIDQVFAVFFKNSDSPRMFMTKMLSSVGISSAFLNNTPLVAMMMPYVNRWSEDKGLSPAKYLIPLSFASILGGGVTLIGTSTNLIVNGLAIDYGEESLSIFDFAYVGLPMLVIGTVYLMLFSGRLLPSSSLQPVEKIQDREYVVETIVNADSPLINKSVEEGGLRNLEGLFLVEIIKKERTVRPAAPHTILRPGDKLIFVGDTKRIADLAKPKLGLSLPEASYLSAKDMDSVVELVVAPNSSLIGRAIKDSDFRGIFNGAIMAIHRDGERVEGKLGEVNLRAGDLLMVLVGKDFSSRMKRTKDFYVLSQVIEVSADQKRGSLLLFIGLLLSIILAMFEWVPLFTSLAVLILASILSGLQRVEDLKHRMDFDLIVIIAMGLALGKGMINSGLAEIIAQAIGGFSAVGGGTLLLALIFIVTNLLTAFITSKAAVSIILPIALSIAHAKGLPIPAIVLIVAYGGAASFITPIGYQTNLMVYGPGGYSFKDFIKIGLPLTILYGAVAVTILHFVYGV